MSGSIQAPGEHFVKILEISENRLHSYINLKNFEKLAIPVFKISKWGLEAQEVTHILNRGRGTIINNLFFEKNSCRELQTWIMHAH